LHHSATDPGPRRNLIDAAGTVAVLANLIPDDAQHRQLADRELARERRRHRTGSSEMATPGNRRGALGSPLRPPGREDRRAAYRNTHRLDLAADDAPAGVEALG
jgi:hypothetical protein